MAGSRCCRCSRKMNSVFGYTTPRVVRIKDWRLGATYYSLIAAIFLYVVIWTIVFQQRYRTKALDIVGSTRLQLHGPVSNFSIPASNLTYCGTAGTNVTVNGNVVPLFPCTYWDQYDAVDPYLEPSALFMATRVTEYPQSLPAKCQGQPTPSCQYVNGNSTTFYVAQPEFFTLLLDHTFSSASLNIARSAMSMPGRMVGQDGELINPCDDYYMAGFKSCDSHVKVGLVNQGADVFPLATLLRAAGIASLEDLSTAIQETHRFAGLILVLSVQYSNFWTDTSAFSENYFTYTYSVQSIVDSEFKAEQSIPEPGSRSLTRTILDRHGLRILVKQSGNIGTFDFATLIITLTSSLGLLAVATLVVDILATRVLPLKALYLRYKQMDSIDLPEVNLNAQDLLVLEQEDLVNPKPAFLRRLASSINASRFRSRFGRSGSGASAGSPQLAPSSLNSAKTPLLAAVSENEDPHLSGGKGGRGGSDGAGEYYDHDDDDLESHRGVSMDGGAGGSGSAPDPESEYAAATQRMGKMASFAATTTGGGIMQKSASALRLNGGSGVAQAYGLPVVAVVASTSSSVSPVSVAAAPPNFGSPTQGSGTNSGRSSLAGTGPRRTSSSTNIRGNSNNGSPYYQQQQQDADTRRSSGISLPLTSGYGAGASAGGLITSPAQGQGSVGPGSARPSGFAGLQRPPMASIASAATADDSDEAER